MYKPYNETTASKQSVHYLFAASCSALFTVGQFIPSLATLSEGAADCGSATASPATCTFADGSFTNIMANSMCTTPISAIEFGRQGVNGVTETSFTTSSITNEVTNRILLTCYRGQLTAQLLDASSTHETAYPDVVSVTCN